MKYTLKNLMVVRTDDGRIQFRDNQFPISDILKYSSRIKDFKLKEKPTKAETKKFRDELLILLVNEKFPTINLQNESDLIYFKNNSKDVRDYTADASAAIDELRTLPNFFFDLNLTKNDWDSFMSDRYKIKNSEKELQLNLKQAMQDKDRAIARAQKQRDDIHANASMVSQIFRLNRDDLPLDVINSIRVKTSEFTDDEQRNEIMNSLFKEEVNLHKEAAIKEYVSDREAFDINKYKTK